MGFVWISHYNIASLDLQYFFVYFEFIILLMFKVKHEFIPNKSQINHYNNFIMKTSMKLILLNILFLLMISFHSCKKEKERYMKVGNDSISDISYTTAKAYAAIIDIGEGVEQHGHCWSTNTESITVDNENKTENGSTNSVGQYYSNLSGLSPNTTYYFKAYVSNGATVVYGSRVLSFHTLALDIPDVITGTVIDITATGATVSGNLNSLGTGATSVTQYGHCWSGETTTPMIEDDNKSSHGSRDSTGSYISYLVGLSENTLYYVRAYATNDVGTAYGDILSFTTDQSGSLPSVVTATLTSVTANSAICWGSIISDGGSAITTKGVCWDTNLNPITTDNHTNDGSGSDPFASTITGLTENTTYYVRAYATNSVGTAYGNHVSFTASDETSIPTVTTTTAGDITETTAVSGGNVAYGGGTDVTARGVCWNTTGTPTTSDNYTTDGSGTGSFNSNITGLSSNITYYVRAYATNSVGTAYGNQISFTTTGSLPVVTTTAASSITATSAQSGGNITSEGESTVTARGVCWNTNGNPTILDSKTTDGSGPGLFTSNISGLSSGTTYYVRAYATNSSGTEYGNQVNFTTLQESGFPVLTTSQVSSITDSTAQSGGNITSEGESTVTARGVCWNTSGNPDISDAHTSDGGGTGSFVSNITGLSSGTTYYVKAYASNSKGTAYGSEYSFTTTGTLDVPIVETGDIVSITPISAAAMGFISSSGTSAVSERGFCYSTTPNPTVASNIITSGTGTGSYNATLSILIPGTTYYIRAYAKNSSGVGYGAEKNFTTSDSYYEGFESGFPPTWTAIGWGITSSITINPYEGFNSLKSSKLNDSIYFTRTVTTSPNGIISFSYGYADMQTGAGTITSFYIDDVLQASFNEAGWTMHTYSFPAGTHTFKWKVTARTSTFGYYPGNVYIDYIIVSP